MLLRLSIQNKIAKIFFGANLENQFKLSENFYCIKNLFLVKRYRKHERGMHT